MKGTRVVRGSLSIDVNDPASSGVRLANELRGRGATEILASLRGAEHVPAPQPE